MCLWNAFRIITIKKPSKNVKTRTSDEILASQCHYLLYFLADIILAFGKPGYARGHVQTLLSSVMCHAPDVRSSSHPAGKGGTPPCCLLAAGCVRFIPSALQDLVGLCKTPAAQYFMVGLTERFMSCGCQLGLRKLNWWPDLVVSFKDQVLNIVKLNNKILLLLRSQWGHKKWKNHKYYQYLLSPTICRVLC